MTNYVQMEMRPSPLEHQHSEMFEFKPKQDDSNGTHSGEFNHSQQESERTNPRAFNAERLLDKVREAEQIQGKMNTSSPTNNHSVQMISQDDSERKLHEKLELELASKEQQIALLLADREKLQSKLIQIADLENRLSEKEQLIGQLKFKLENQADYDDIKQELHTLKSNESSSPSRSMDDQNDNRSKKSLDLILAEKNRTFHGEQPSVKTLPTDPECQQSTSNQSFGRCSSPCLNRINPTSISVSSLLASSSASSSSNGSSSPSSPSQIYPKTHPSLLVHTQDSDEINKPFNDSSMKFISPLSLNNLSSKDNVQLSNKYSSIPSSCSTMVTPTASLLSSVPSTTATISPSNLFGGHQVSSVQCTKLYCAPTSSWSPPLSSSSDLSTMATTSKDNVNTVTRTVIKPSRQTSPKPSPSPTVLVQSACAPISTNNPSLEPLDTTCVADVVRKLLAQHNIGQRIFARYVLSLSQGTVSELLSKPKAWSKLTEKGKESYRKMWAWANSEADVLKLKSISPRKGMNNRSKDNPYPNLMQKHTDSTTQQKIVQLLSDPQKQQVGTSVNNQDHKASVSPCSSLPNETANANLLSNSFESKPYLSQTPSSSSSAVSNSSVSSTANSPLHESTHNDPSSYLLPVQPPPLPSSAASSSTANSISMLSSFVPSLLMRATNGFSNESTESYRSWLMLQEIFRNSDPLKQFKPNLPPITPMNVENHEQDNEDDDGDNVDDENDEDRDEHHLHLEHEPSQSINSNDDDDDHGRVTEDEDQENDDDDDDDAQNNNEETPLDLSMKVDSTQSDTETNLLTFTNQKSSSATKSTKTALPPLREQDTLKYRYINTNELVQTVKDILSRYSISQRHFGEKILGLSQGSVSDILARPKSWELLTQKGREPFLRMKIFLDDSNAINQLIQAVSTNPTGAPTSLLGSSFCSSLGSPSMISTSSLLNNPILNGFHPSNLLLRDHPTESQPNLLSNENSQLSTNGNLTIPPSSSPLLSNGLSVSSNKSKSRSKTSKTNIGKTSPNPPRNPSTHPTMTPYELPKITLPPTIDTEQLSSQVRELLFNYSIGQRVFGEAVLNLSQGTVSEILSKPRSWHSLSVKGREPYIRMYTWFNDPGNVQKLLAWKRDRDALRRSRPAVNSQSTTNSPPTMANMNMQDSIDVNNPHGNSLMKNSSNTPNRPKRRSIYTDRQRRILKQSFSNDPYPNPETLDQLANELSLPLARISNWFHNARMRAKIFVRSSTSPVMNFSSSLLNNNDNNNVNEQSEDEDEYVDNNNNPNNDDQDDDDDELDHIDSGRPTIVTLASSWLIEVNDSNSAPSPTAISTNNISIANEPKNVPILSTSSSSSKKRKSVPQKLITTNNAAKKFTTGSTIVEHENYNTSSNDESLSINQTTNESTAFVDILS